MTALTRRAWLNGLIGMGLLSWGTPRLKAAGGQQARTAMNPTLRLDVRGLAGLIVLRQTTRTGTPMAVDIALVDPTATASSGLHHAHIPTLSVPRALIARTEIPPAAVDDFYAHWPLTAWNLDVVGGQSSPLAINEDSIAAPPSEGNWGSHKWLIDLDEHYGKDFALIPSWRESSSVNTVVRLSRGASVGGSLSIGEFGSTAYKPIAMWALVVGNTEKVPARHYRHFTLADLSWAGAAGNRRIDLLFKNRRDRQLRRVALRYSRIDLPLRINSVPAHYETAEAQTEQPDLLAWGDLYDVPSESRFRPVRKVLLLDERSRSESCGCCNKVTASEVIYSDRLPEL